MDQLPSFGRSISEIVGPTYKIYGSILQTQAAKINSTPSKTFAYGSDPRQNLDVYYPSSADVHLISCPILVFLYGGGLVFGSKNMPGGLVYANLGHYFAERHGYIVVVADYRLVPQARFPSGGEDLALVIGWVSSNMQELGGSGGAHSLFLMGNSAGGVHLSTYLFSPAFAESRKQVLNQESESSLRLRGAILVSVPFHFEAASGSREDVLKTYYGGRRSEDSPLGLLKSLAQEGSISEALPGVTLLILTATLDPNDEILDPNKDFMDFWKAQRASSASDPQIGIIEGHNHISPVLGLGTGDVREEEWGRQVADFCKSVGGQ